MLKGILSVCLHFLGKITGSRVTSVRLKSNTCRTLVEHLQKVSLMNHEDPQHLTCLPPLSRQEKGENTEVYC